MNKCSICKKEFESDDPAMICVNGEGLPCLICDVCEKNLDTILYGDDRTEVEKALDYICTKFDGSHSTIVMKAVNEILSSAGDTAKQIREERKRN